MVGLRLLVAILLQGFLVQAKSFLPEAVKFALANSFNKTADLVHVVIDAEYRENTIGFIDVVDNILVDNYWTFQFQIDVNNENIKSVSDHNLWFIDSYQAFRRLLAGIRNYNRDSQLFYFIVLNCSNIEGHLDLTQSIFSDFVTLLVANVNLLIETTPGEVSFYTFYPYQKLACRSAKPFIIFHVNQHTMEHDKVSLFPPKANNFYGCPIRIKTRNPNLYSFTKHEIYHIETVIVNELASRLNFIKDIIKILPWDFGILNENSSGLHQSLENGEIDMVLGMYSNDAKITRFLSSITYVMSYVVIALLRPGTYVFRRYVWLLISFDSSTWTCILLSLASITGCVLYVKKTGRFVSVLKFQHVGFLEILAVSIGSSIGHLPKKNCLRFVFVVLSFGALVLRTAYLGKLFDAYRVITKEQPANDFKELLAENYIIYSHEYFATFINEINGYENVHFENLDSQGLEVLFDAGKKSAVFTTFTYIYYNSSREERRNLMMETVLGQHICIFIPHHSIILPRFNEVIERLEEAGILYHHRRNYDTINEYVFSPDNMEKHANEHEQKPLDFERFSLAFYLFLGLNAIACLIFAMELLWHKLISMSP